MIIGFLLTTVLFPVNILFYDFCGVYNHMISTATAFGSYTSVIPASASGYMNTCLFGDGKIGAAFNVDASLKTVNDVSDQFNSFDKFANDPNY